MMNIKFPCGVCCKPVANNHNALCCDSCDSWVHIKCNFLNKYTYKKLQKDKSPWFCINCIKSQLPFQSQVNIDLQSEHNSLAAKKAKLEEIFEHLDLDEDCPSTEFYTPCEFSKLNLEKSHLYIHLNISSLSFHIDELHLLLSQIKHRPKIIAITESKLRKNKDSLTIKYSINQSINQSIIYIFSD